jgi:hypothetical protein
MATFTGSGMGYASTVLEVGDTASDYELDHIVDFGHYVESGTVTEGTYMIYICYTQATVDGTTSLNTQNASPSFQLMNGTTALNTSHFTITWHNGFNWTYNSNESSTGSQRFFSGTNPTFPSTLHSAVVRMQLRVETGNCAYRGQIIGPIAPDKGRPIQGYFHGRVHDYTNLPTHIRLFTYYVAIGSDVYFPRCVASSYRMNKSW